MREVEKKISDLKKEKFTDFTKPVAAFIMFEEEDAKRVALNFYAPSYTYFGNLIPS